MPAIPTHRRVVLARSVASKYLIDAATPEYRLSIIMDGYETRNVPGILNGFRDGRLKLGGLASPKDFGVREDFDAITVWSADENALHKVAAWFESRGFETSGVH